MSRTALQDRPKTPREGATTGGTPDARQTRRAVLGGLISALAMPAAPALAHAPAVLRRAGEFRSIALSNAHTGEWLDTVYWADGAYVPEALGALNRLLRDWREDEVHRIDPGVIDILAAVRALLDCGEPYLVVSGYRTRKTNAMLRRRYKGVARNSYHCEGMAADIRIKGRSVRQISRAALSLGRGGVGRYTRSNFVHLDSGPVRKWGS